jgi:hypothetical protein
MRQAYCVGTHTLQRALQLYSLYSSTALYPLQYTSLYNTPLHLSIAITERGTSTILPTESVGCRLQTGGTIVELGQKRAHSTLPKRKLPLQGWSTYISLNQQNENRRAPP